MSQELANWPEHDTEDMVQTTQAWQDPDDGTLLVIEQGTGSWKDDLNGDTWSLRIINAPFWEDPCILDTLSKHQNEGAAEDAAMEYMADHRL